jgi:hypothetical protein
MDETGRPTRRRVAYATLPDPVRDELAAFVDRHLLITDDVDGVISIGVTHEAFLTAWSPLADAVAKARVAWTPRRDSNHSAAGAATAAASGRLHRRVLLRAGTLAAIAGTVAISVGSDAPDAGATIAIVGQASLILDPGNLITHEHRLPAGGRRGDLILGSIQVEDASSFRVPPGFAHVATATASNGYGPMTVMFARWADRGEESVAITFERYDSKSSCVALYRGVDPARSFVDVATAANKGGPSITVGSVDATERGRLVMVVGACANREPGSWIRSPIGMSRRAVGTDSYRGMVVYDQAVEAGKALARTAVRDGPTHQSAILVVLRGK